MREYAVLKDQTRSLCPVCCREIAARVYEEESGVFMEKTCPDHGRTVAQVEKSPVVYRALMNARTECRPPVSLVLPITHRCNLRCHMCFLPQDGVPDPPASAVRRVMDEFPGDVVFSGGEPTLREDLPDLIAYAVRRGKGTCLATNGLSLDNKDAVARLADAGLASCTFSLNGLSDRVFEGIEGRPLLSRKLAALENLRRSSIAVAFSTTILPGLNESELPGLKDRFVAEGGPLYRWRLRTHAALGRHLETPVLWMSDILRLVCDNWGIDRDALLQSVQAGCRFHGVTHLYFTIRRQSGADDAPLAARAHDMTSGRQRARSGEGVLWAGLHRLGRLIGRGGGARRRAGRHGLESHVCKIRLFAWPDITNVDLNEVSQTGIWHVGPGGKPMPFVEAVIRNNAQPDWVWK